jgi:4-hydroxy-3-polyprenylbenzoate decarboxylase
MNTGTIEPQWRYGDLREWMEEAERLGELRRVTGASWQEEIGLAADVVVPRDDGPAVLFDEVPGCPKGFRLLMNVFAGKRRAMTLGFPDGLTKQELSQAYFDHYQNKQQHLPPVIVEDGPVFENVLTGAAVDISKFPTPVWHVNDGGRYIGTGCYSVTMDPDERWINVGCYRAMIQDAKSVSLLMVPGKHGYMHREKYFRRGEKMPLALVVGGDPLFFFMGGTEHPYGLCEYDIVGGMRGKPVELVRGKITGLPFPANAEIVLEGFLSNDNRKNEGPFGEWTGYYASNQAAVPVIRVKAVYHRNDPILCGFPLLKPSSGDNLHFSLMRSALIWNALDEAGVPDVQAVWAHPSGGRFMTVLSIRQRYPGHAKQAAMIASQCRSGAYLGRYVIVVDDDIDITNSEEVIWAISSRSDPAQSIDILRRCWSGPLDPRIPVEDKGFSSRAIIDATRPYEWREKFPKVSGASRELKSEIGKKWNSFLDDKIR